MVIGHNLSSQILPVSFFTGKTCKDLVIELFRPSTLLAVQTPFFIEVLNQDEVPLQLFPELSLKERPSKYSKPDYSLLAVDESRISTFSVFVQPIVSDCEEIPVFPASFELNQELTAKTIMNAIDNSFKMEHTGTTFIGFNETTPVDDILHRAKTQGIQMQCEISDSAKKCISMRRNIIMEIQTTEETYISGLQTIVNVWQPRMTQSGKFTPDELSIMFKHFPVILQYHSTFLQQLKERGCSFSANISDIFLEFASFFKVSIPYISGYERLINLVSNKRKTDRELFILDDGREFSAFLITPVQRMPRYILFLRELMKATPTSHPDYPMLELASKRVQEVTEETDEATRQAANVNEIIELQQALAKPLNIMSPGRTLLKVLSVNKLKRGGKIFLFNDMVLVAIGNKRDMKVIWMGSLIEFKYFSLLCDISFYTQKGKLRSITFGNIVEKQQFLDELENARMKCYPNPAAMFLWTSPFLGKLLPDMKYWASVTFKRKSYFVGGGKMVRYSFRNGAVAVIDTPFTGFSGFTVVFFDKKLYVVGGCESGGDPVSDVWIYDITSRQWSKEKSPLEPRYGHSSVVYNDSMFVFGGRKKKAFFNDLWMYSFATGTWKLLDVSGAPSPRSRHSVSIVGGKMYLYGGESGEELFNDVFVLDLRELSWTKLNIGSTLPKSIGHRLVSIGLLIIFIGGVDELKHDVNYGFVFNTETSQLTQFNNIGNNPSNVVDFGLEFDGEKLLVMFSNSLFCVNLPQSVQEYVQTIETETPSMSQSMTEDSLTDIKSFDTENTAEVNENTETVVDDEETEESISLPQLQNEPSSDSVKPDSSVEPILPPASESEHESVAEAPEEIEIQPEPSPEEEEIVSEQVCRQLEEEEEEDRVEEESENSVQEEEQLMELHEEEEQEEEVTEEPVASEHEPSSVSVSEEWEEPQIPEERGEWFIPGVIDADCHVPGAPEQDVVITLSLKEGATVMVSPKKKPRKPKTRAITPFAKRDFGSSRDVRTFNASRTRNIQSPFTPKLDRGRQQGRVVSPFSRGESSVRTTQKKLDTSSKSEVPVIEALARIRKGSTVKLARIRSNETLQEIRQKIASLFTSIVWNTIEIQCPNGKRQPLTPESLRTALVELKCQHGTYLGLILT